MNPFLAQNYGTVMKILAFFTFTLLLLFPVTSVAGKNTTLAKIAKEPVTMMDLGILKLNASLSRSKLPGLRGATIEAKYNARRGTIDIKVSKPIKKASKAQCKQLLMTTKKLFLQPYGKKKISNIHYYFQHEGTAYTKSINWDDLPNHVVITAIVLTKKNYQQSTYCQSYLMKNKVTY
jgi:hypothetical protein